MAADSFAAHRGRSSRLADRAADMTLFNVFARDIDGKVRMLGQADTRDLAKMMQEIGSADPFTQASWFTDDGKPGDILTGNDEWQKRFRSMP
jgi:hypothetical protein